MKYLLSAALACASLADAAAFPQPMAIYPRQNSSKPEVDSKTLQADVSKDNLLKKAQHLQELAESNGGNRKWGSPGHEATLNWIEEELKATNYYKVERQFFNISLTKVDSVSVDISDGSKANFTYAFQPGQNGDIEGEVVVINNLGCNTTDYPAEVKGKIALISRGECPHGARNAKATNAGAIGIINYNDDRPPPDMPELGNAKDYNISDFIPGVFIDKATGVALKEKIIKGGYEKITAKLHIKTHKEQQPTANIIAESIEGDPNVVITSGAHSDSVVEGPGINDDGSGTMSQIEVAVALAKYSVKNKVRWCWWSAEEDGLLGSNYYTQNLSEEEKAKIVLNLDFDMLASNNYVFSVYDGDGSEFGEDNKGPEGCGHIEQTFINFFKDNNLNYTGTPFDGRSDYEGFNEVGIPAGGIAMGAEGIKTANETAMFGGVTGEPYDKCYHQACDKVDNLNMEAWEIGTKCVADSVARYAQSVEGMAFPRNNTTTPPKLKKRGVPMTTDGAMVPTYARYHGAVDYTT